MTFSQRDGKRLALLFEGTFAWPVPRAWAENTLVKALARAFRWKRMLDSGEFATIGELARREGIAVSYLARINGRTLLAPDIVEAVLDERQRPEETLTRLLEQFPVEWAPQRELWLADELPPSSAMRF